MLATFLWRAARLRGRRRAFVALVALMSAASAVAFGQAGSPTLASWPGSIAWIESRDGSGVGTLYVAHGGRIRRASPRGAFGPAVSPGGKWVLVGQEKGEQFALRLHRADGSAPSRVVFSSGASFAHADWSADGQRFAVVELDARFRAHLLVCEAESLHCERWARGRTLLATRPILSPDGRQAAWADGNRVLVVGADRRVGVVMRDDGSPFLDVVAWAPRGPVVWRSAGKRAGLHVIDNGGLAALRLAPPAKSRTGPSITGTGPDERFIMLGERKRVVVVDSDRGTSTVVFRHPGASGDPAGVLSDETAVIAQLFGGLVLVNDGRTIDRIPRVGYRRVIVDAAAG